MSMPPEGLQQTRGIAKSQAAAAEAMKVLAGGVNSPVRAFRAVGGTPRFIAKAEGAFLVDIDGNEYIDYVGSWGPMILGHADERVAAAAGKVLDKGWSFGAPTELETRLAERIVEDYPSITNRLRSAKLAATPAPRDNL